MADKKVVKILVIFSIIILVFVLIKIKLPQKIINFFESIKTINQYEIDKQNDYPCYIYETFIDGDGKEVSIKMERKTGTIDGEEIVFYEDTIGSEVIYYRFYKGTIIDVDNGKIIFLVDKECLDGKPEDQYYEYEDVEDYELVFYLDDYISENINNGNKDRISINTEIVKNFNNLEKIIGKNLRVCDSKYKDPISNCLSKQIDFFTN
jgi:hypothetical protein